MYFFKNENIFISFLINFRNRHQPITIIINLHYFKKHSSISHAKNKNSDTVNSDDDKNNYSYLYLNRSYVNNKNSG